MGRAAQATLMVGWSVLAVASAACTGPQPRDPDFPQYVRPRSETLAWRRLTDQPSPELGVTPPPRVDPPSATEAATRTPAPAVAASCRAVPSAPSCTRAAQKAFACGLYDGSASAEPPVEIVFFAATPAEAETAAKAAVQRGAVPLPARACRIVAFDVCGPSLDVTCTDDHGHTTAVTRVTL